MNEATTAAIEVGAEGLDFGQAWLRTWTDLGGSVTYDAFNEKWGMWLPCYSLSIVAEDNALFYEAWKQDGLANVPDADVEQTLSDRRRFDQHWWEGKMRGLSDFLDEVPHGRNAVEAVLINEPDLGIARLEARQP